MTAHDQELLQEILRDTAALVNAAAHPRRRTIALSTETAGALASLGTNRSSADGVAEQSKTESATVVRESSGEDAVPGLQALAREVAVCTKCPLCKTRTQTVFSDGSPYADLVFVGEAPGFNEDQQGVPFVGAAGQLLTDIIEKGMNLRRQDVYICNVIKCRPPENRDPTMSEKESCEPYLVRQLELVRPKVICALGGHAAKTLLKTEASTGSLRGKWHFYHGIPLRVTYHPAYLLRSPAEKRKTWDDVREVMRVLKGEVVPEPATGGATGDGFDQQS